MRICIALIILLCVSISPASSFSTGDIEWASAVTGTLYKGNSLANGEYTVKAVELASPVQGYKNFNGDIVPETPVEPSVLLDIYKNGVFVREIVMSLQSGAYIDPDYEVMISATGFTAKNSRDWVYEYYNPWASISISLRGKPKLELTLTTDKTAYTSNSDQIITATITIKNSGDAFAENIDVNLVIGDLKLRGGDIRELHHYYTRMNKGESQSFATLLLVPGLIDQKSYNLSMNAKGNDLKGLDYNTATSLSITVSPAQNYFIMSKSVKDRMYLKNSAAVMITVSNGGIYDINNIHINDRMNENFDVKSDTPLQWDITLLKPGEDWRTTYSIKPLEASLSGFIIPLAVANFTVNNKPYTASSQAITLVVNGPKIILNKTVSKPVINISERVTVTVTLKNVGDIGTRFELIDSLPDGVNLVEGSTSLSNWLDPNTVQGFSYNISMDTEGKFELPAAILNYTNVEYRGTTREVKSSDKPEITVVDPGKPVPNSTVIQTSNGSENTTRQRAADTIPAGNIQPTPLTPGFGSIFSIIILILVAVLRRK
ncbi:MAG: hypothetical protein OIN86_07790 [Candidatus Methanoperedens sp.]|nr:hypothetical protein [Candidatus Methanoperedens sp.]CAG0976412.1 hypothetical protein METP1_01528 [Methanosarcinales archaeon]